MIAWAIVNRGHKTTRYPVLVEILLPLRVQGLSSTRDDEVTVFAAPLHDRSFGLPGGQFVSFPDLRDRGGTGRRVGQWCDGGPETLQRVQLTASRGEKPLEVRAGQIQGVDSVAGGSVRRRGPGSAPLDGFKERPAHTGAKSHT